MISVSYTLSPFLKKQVEHIEKLRNDSLLVLLPPKDEHTMRYSMQILRITKALELMHMIINSKQVEAIMKPEGKKVLTSNEKAAYSYKRAYDYIYYNHFLNDDKLTAKGVHTLLSHMTSDPITVNEQELEHMLSFVQINPEHPIIQAGIVSLLFYQLMGQADTYRVPALLIAYLFLYKHGYYFRGTLVLEEYITQHAKSLYEVARTSLESNNISPYLDHFVFALTNQAEKAYNIVTNKRLPSYTPATYFDLTERQKEIIALFDRPGTRVTNKVIQKLFTVSQITASRELSKLASLGILMQLGKGRSIYYTLV